MRVVVGIAAVLVAWGRAAALSGQAAAGIAARQQALELEWTAADERSEKKKVNVVRRVINLLTKMQEELNAEAAKEAEMYDQMVCWCKTNEKEKTEAVAAAETADVELTAEIESRAARFGELGTNIEILKKEIQANQETLDKATAIREDEASKFSAMEKDLVQYVANLKNAVTVLSKHQASMLQLDSSLLSGLRVLLRDAALKMDLISAGREERNGPVHVALLATHEAHNRGSSDQQRAALLQALNTHAGSVSDALPVKFAQEVIARAAAAASGVFLQKNPAGGSSTGFVQQRGPSSEIFGVIQQMQQEFETQLTTAQKEELQAQEDFKALAAAKSNEIEVGKKKLDDFEVEHANNQKALSDAKENLAMTRQQRSEDVEFLRNLKLTCNDLDDQWNKRTSTRNAEMTAVAEAITILSEDDNREHLAATTLLQVASDSAAAARARRVSAAAALRRAAQAPDFDADDLLTAWSGRGVPAAVGPAAGPRMQLATLATAVQLDAFTKVKELMDKMIADLKDQQAEEVKFKDHCNGEMGSTEKTLYDKGEFKKDLVASLDRLQNLIVKLEGEIQEHREQMAAAQTEIKRAGQQREQENKEFQAVVADQRATQEILTKALAKLKDFYEKNIGNKNVFLQQHGKQTPPVQFNDFKTNAGSSSVIGMLEQIIEDSKVLEGEATKSETDAQAAYETFVRDSNGLISTLQETVTEKTRAIAASKEEHALTNADHESTVDELASLTAYQADLHSRCDFVLKNFDIRQNARLQEIEAIQQAKAILSGAR